ncbi:MAG: tyrosine recombinase XerC [Ruminococcaceae bacterium]|nr:tyrosine recombinase XerC [Oscillospiraceae bacterium]
MNYNDAPEIIKEFLFYCRTIKNRSPRTVQGYYLDLRTFFRFLKFKKFNLPDDTEFSKIDIRDLDIEFLSKVSRIDIYEYLQYVTYVRKNSSNSVARKLSCLKSYFKYMSEKTKIINDNPTANIDSPSVKKSLPKFLSLDESRKLLESVGGDYESRDYCIITLFLNCGMRLSELVGIDLDDISDDTLRVLGKGNKERIVFLNDACVNAINSYLIDRNGENYKVIDKNALFLNRNGRRISPRRVQQIVDENLNKAGLSNKGYSTHKLRHTAATLMYRYGDVDMLALKEILGHEHVSTTEIYTHISDKQLKSAMHSNPLSDIKPDNKKKKSKKN